MKSEKERLEKKRFYRRWKKIVSVLACIVVFCTTYALILPAITKEKVTDCGIEEHQHGEECYSEKNELICTKQEHQHGEECFSDSETDMKADADITKDPDTGTQVEGETTTGTDGEEAVPGTEMADGEETIPGTEITDGEEAVPGTEITDGEEVVPGTEITDGEEAVPGTEIMDGEEIVPETEMTAEEELAAAAVAREGTSITGQLVTRSNLSYYVSYLIITANPVNNTYYALSGSGKGIPIDYNPTTGTANIGADVNLADIQWFAEDYSPSTLFRDTKVVLKNVSTGRYLDLNTNQVTGTASASLSASGKRGATDQTLLSYSNRYLAFWENTDLGYPMFGSATSSSGAVGVRFVAYVNENIPVESSGVHQEVEYNFPNHKTIDYLGDGDANSDTEAQGEDLYRLYLDITGQTEPIDLLIMVDRSSSMKSNTDMGGRARYRVVNELLNGSEGAVTEQGLVSRALNANPENQVAVCSFEGKVTANDTENGTRILGSKSLGYDYTVDSAIAIGWYTKETYNNELIDITPPDYQGTNYEAGLMRAKAMFDSVKGDGHKKIMIFMSDGVPTYYIDQNGNRQGDSYAGNNATACSEPSKRAFDAFQKEHPDVIVHTVAIYGDSESASEYSPEVLQYMAKNSDGNFIGATSTEILLNIGKVIYPSGVVITDELSEYVDYYETMPDLKVVRSHKDKGTEVLYPNETGTDIIQSVGCDSQGRVSLVFRPDFIMQSGWVYTLSFNVKATQKAYDDYAQKDYTDLEGKQILGDTGTDYTANETSSEKSGFHSNIKAEVTYFVGNNNKQYKQQYDNPVIQADRCQLILTKKNDAGEPLRDVGFNLMRDNTLVGTYTTGQDGTLAIPSQVLITGNYTLQEATVPEGYLPAAADVAFRVEQGRILHEESSGDWTWGEDPEKVILPVNNYRKNNTYEYRLTLVNHMKSKKILLKKVDDAGNPLEGAVFTLYKNCTAETEGAHSFRIMENWLDETYKTVWGSEVQAGLKSEGAEGILYQADLEGGIYYLIETSAPDGYNRLEEPVVIKVAGDGVTFGYRGKTLHTEMSGSDPVIYSAEIQNIPGTRLPETGGTGKGGYIIGGLALMSGACILLYDREVKKRKGAKMS